MAAFGAKACRMHGAHKKHARLAGSDHPNFKHGNETIEARSERRRMLLILQHLEDISRSVSLFT